MEETAIDPSVVAAKIAPAPTLVEPRMIAAKTARRDLPRGEVRLSKETLLLKVAVVYVIVLVLRQLTPADVRLLSRPGRFRP